MLKWLFNCTPAFADLIRKQNPKGVVFGEARGPNPNGFVGYYIDPELIERCPADLEPTKEDDPNADL